MNVTSPYWVWGPPSNISQTDIELERNSISLFWKPAVHASKTSAHGMHSMPLTVVLFVPR